MPTLVTDSAPPDGLDAIIEVAIIGGGPVGVATALFCHAHGLRVAVFERQHDVYPLPRAIAMDDEIQRAFASIGLGAELDAITSPMLGAEFVDASGTRLVGADLPLDADWPLGHHPVVVYHQPTLEAMLRTALAARSIPLHLDTEVTAFGDLLDAGVELSVSHDGADRVERARWVVACDGASSGVRKQLGIALTDLGFDQEWIVCDVRMHRDIGLKALTQQVCDPTRVTTLVPGVPPWRRWEIQMRPDERGADLNTPAGLAALLSAWLTPGDATIERSAVYRFHATVAERMRDGNVFIAGDAAHQMPPFLGQGLCSGVRDGIDLAWKLALLKAGRATAALLDTYGEERLPHAAGVVHHAVDTGRLIDHLAAAGNPDDTTAGYGGGRPFPVLTGGLNVPGHPSVGRQIANPRLADGSRLDDHLGTGFAVLVAPDQVAAGQAIATTLFGRATEGATGHDVPVIGVDPALLPFTLDGSRAAIVRPDRFVAAVIDPRDPAALSRVVDVFVRAGMHI